MSSLQKTNSGYRLQFRIKGKPGQISLRGLKKRAAEQIRAHIDELIDSQRRHAKPGGTTTDWVEGLPDEMFQRLLWLGLVEERSVQTPMLDLFDEFVRQKEQLAASTYRNYMQLRRKFWQCFGLKKIDKFTRGDAADFRQFCLHTMSLGENTVRKRCSQASTFWRWLIRHEIVTVNIWEDVPKSVGTAITEKATVSAETIVAVMAATDNLEWKALIALGRWGGLRVPSEPFAMRWQDIDWANDRLKIHSSKTAKQGKPNREIPLFPELVKPLLALAEVGSSEYVFPQTRMKSGNVRRPFQQIIARAGIDVWPHLWKSLRSTRETELAATYPLHVVCEWMGNSHAVALKHYLKATDDDFRRASADILPTPDADSKDSETFLEQPKNE